MGEYYEVNPTVIDVQLISRRLFPHYWRPACGFRIHIRPGVRKFWKLWEDRGKSEEDLSASVRTRRVRLSNTNVAVAPGIEPDLDDSARASIIFSLLGRPGFTRRIIEEYDSSTCLKTYAAERNPSVSANCNALLSIVLDSEEYPSKCEAIEKITVFICDSWWAMNGSFNDKWVR